MILDQSLLQVNKIIKNMLLEFMPQDSTVEILFGIPPEVDTPPTTPTFSVFLNQLEEDTEMRHGAFGTYNEEGDLYLPGAVNVRCSYYITYWDGSEEAEDIEPDGQMMTVVNAALNALINNRQLTFTINDVDYPISAYTRLMPVQTSPFTYTGFWQCLGNKPRLVLVYVVTIPVTKQPVIIEDSPVTKISMDTDQKPSTDIYKEAADILWSRIHDAIIDEIVDSYEQKAQLNKLSITTRPVASTDQDKSEISVTVQATVESLLNDLIIPEITLWEDTTSPENTVTIGNMELAIQEVINNITVI